MISSPAAKLDEVIFESDRWMSCPMMTHQALQRLLGHLGHVTSWAPTRQPQRAGGLPPSRDALVDAEGNGVHLLPPLVRPIWVIECNSCLHTSLLRRGLLPHLHCCLPVNLLITVRHLVSPTILRALLSSSTLTTPPPSTRAAR